MRAIRQDFLRRGRGTNQHHRSQINTPIGLALVQGVVLVLTRFGDRPENRVRVNEAFEAYEHMLSRHGLSISPTNVYDRDDDPDSDDEGKNGKNGKDKAPTFETGSTFGNITMGGPFVPCGGGCGKSIFSRLQISLTS